MIDNTLDAAINMLFSYLRDAIYAPGKASLTVEDLPEYLQDLGSGIKYYTKCVMETSAFALALSKGALDDAMPSRGNEIAAPLKSLQASLKHMTWQTQQIAQGDYNQRVAFMGDFTSAFNTMVEQLAEREQNLEDQIHQIKNKTTALEQGNHLLASLLHYIPQQIYVIDKKTKKVLLTNNIAADEVIKNINYSDELMSLISEHGERESGSELDIVYEHNGVKRDFIIKYYFLEWHDTEAAVYVINDISETRKEIADLEEYACRDSLTQLYNRAYGMKILDIWLHEKREFSLIFIDLNGLKYVNDEFGHEEGNIFITRACDHFRDFSDSAVVCRIGGDEFMILASCWSYDDANKRMTEITSNLRNDEYQMDKEFSYSMSFGISSVNENNRLSASEILSIADFRMYDNKKKNKMQAKKERESNNL